MASRLNSDSITVLLAIGSPVKLDSFTCNEIASRSTPSAGISSPCSNSTMSSTTMSFLGTSCTLPLRITLTNVSSFTWFSTSNFLFASHTNQVATPVASKMATAIPMVSAISMIPSEKYMEMAIPPERNTATINMRMTGSSKFPIKICHKESLLGGVNTLAPCFSRLSSTCLSVRPV